MKKLINLILILLSLLTLTSCFGESPGENNKPVNPDEQKPTPKLKDPKTLKLHLFNQKSNKFELFKELKVEKNTQLNSLVEPFTSNKEYFLGWFKDQEYQERFRTKISLKPDTITADTELYGQILPRNTVDLPIQALKEDQTKEEKKWNTVQTQTKTNTSLKLTLNAYIEPELIGINKYTGEEFKYWRKINTSNLEELTFTATFTQINEELRKYFHNFRLKITLNKTEYEFPIKNTLEFRPKGFNFGEDYYLKDITKINIELIADKIGEHNNELSEFAELKIANFNLIYQIEKFKERTR